MTQSYSYAHPHYAVAVDIVVFRFEENRLLVAFEKRGKEPYSGRWALPGAYLHEHETAAQTAARTTARFEINLAALEQLQTFDEPNRDPRERTFSIAYLACVRPKHRGTNLEWFNAFKLPPNDQIAFDHAEIVAKALERIKGKIIYSPLAVHLLENEFSVSEIKTVYEKILGRKLDKRNFYKKFTALPGFKPAGLSSGTVGPRKQLYRYSAGGKSRLFQLP